VYGQILDRKFSGADQLDPRNPYAATRAGADLLAKSYRTTHYLPVLITRTSNNFGPRQHPEKLIPKFIRNAAAGETLPVYGDGSNVREWLYVEDNCRALDLVLREGEIGEIYNIGSHAEKTNLEVTEAILDAVDVDDNLIKFVEDRAGHDQRYALQTAKIEALGWEPTYTFEKGLEQTVRHYLDRSMSDEKPIPAEEWETIVANVPLVSVGLVVEHDGGIPLCKRENGPVKGGWFVLSGTVLKNESRSDAVHRVADKELGESVVIKDYLGTREHFYDTSEIKGVNSKHYVATAYRCHLEHEDPEFNGDGQHSALELFYPSFEGHHPYVERYLKVLDDRSDETRSDTFQGRCDSSDQDNLPS
jgi:ADP-ribose pyrophosphatase YjhB (NUDIX family)